MYKMALADGLVQRSPVEGVKLPRVRRNEPAPLTHEQVWRLVAKMDARDRIMVLVMAYGGCVGASASR